MTIDRIPSEDKNPAKLRSAAAGQQAKRHADGSQASGITNLLRQVGNRVVQRMLAQPSGDTAAQLDDETADRINRERGGGHPLEGTSQEQLGGAMGQNFSGVRVHTSPEANNLNRQLSAKAFTTGSDIFFREGAYDPHSSGGQELIAHELTHVVQQRSRAVSAGGGKMTVNAPGDAFEQEADSVAKAVTTPGPAGEGASSGLQHQEEGEAAVQTQPDTAIPDEEDETVQMQPDSAIPDDEEEPVQMQADTSIPEDEEVPVQMQADEVAVDDEEEFE